MVESAVVVPAVSVLGVFVFAAAFAVPVLVVFGAATPGVSIETVTVVGTTLILVVTWTVVPVVVAVAEA